MDIKIKSKISYYQVDLREAFVQSRFAFLIKGFDDAKRKKSKSQITDGNFVYATLLAVVPKRLYVS